MNGRVPLFPRYIRPRMAEALSDTPVVLLSGPRQAGKTTLVRQFSGPDRRFVTLDDEVASGCPAGSRWFGAALTAP